MPQLEWRFPLFVIVGPSDVEKLPTGLFQLKSGYTLKIAERGEHKAVCLFTSNETAKRYIRFFECGPQAIFTIENTHDLIAILSGRFGPDLTDAFIDFTGEQTENPIFRIAHILDVARQILDAQLQGTADNQWVLPNQGRRKTDNR
jgi:hypothetical protein